MTPVEIHAVLTRFPTHPVYITIVSPSTGGLVGGPPSLEGRTGPDHNAVVLLQAGQLPTVSIGVAGIGGFAFLLAQGKATVSTPNKVNKIPIKSIRMYIKGITSIFVKIRPTFARVP